MTIAEVSKKYDVSVDTLRYYEKVGLIPRVRRTQGGLRDYTQSDCNWVHFIKCMRSAGLPIEVLIQYVDLFVQGDSTIEARKNLLIEQRNQLLLRMAEMQETLDHLNYKIEQYDKSVIPAEQKLKKSED